MDFNELKQDAEKLCKELKDKAPADLSVLVLSLTTIINMMLTMFSNSMEQNNKLLATISDLQKTIKDLKRQLNMDSHNSSKPPSSDGYKKANKNRSLREKTGRKTGGQKGQKGENKKNPQEPKKIKVHITKKKKK